MIQNQVLDYEARLLKLELEGIKVNGSSERVSKELETNSTLTISGLSEYGIENISKLLKSNPTLTVLILSENGLNKGHAKHILDIFKSNSTLTRLDLDTNIIGEGIKHISNLLKENSTLTQLNLANNKIGLHNRAREGIEHLSESLKTNTTLIKLDLGQNGIGEEGARYISESLISNTTLVVLNLQKNGIGEEGAIYISELLISNTTLTELDLSNNKFGVEGAKNISQSLKSNSSLSLLKFNGNDAGSDGVNHIWESLSSNSTLTVLDLGNNNITDESLPSLASILSTNDPKSNITLTQLNLSHNKISDSLQLIATVIKDNSTITSLNLAHNKIEKVTACKIYQSLKLNSKLTYFNLVGNNIGDENEKIISELYKPTTTTTGCQFNIRSRTIKDFEYEELGEGCFGKVYSNITVKKFSFGVVGVETFKKISPLKHENLLETIGFGETNSTQLFLCTIHEKCSLQFVLNDMMNQGWTFTRREVHVISVDIACGLHYLHKSKICHGNIHLENLLVSKGFIIKIADFGLANQSPSSNPVGDPYFMAPELLEYGTSSKSYNEKCDIWSFGVVLCLLLGGESKPSTISIEESIRKCNENYKDDPPLIRVLEGCLREDQSQRLKANQILKELLQRSFQFTQNVNSHIEYYKRLWENTSL
eukprot:TRINITY_DN1309_c0_g1_i5.p1 TRINITY_DN1309_c0_g1~~TRINITY_DN1309_c0_g1_i5.p1  ORF type:complete len:653 (+),score=115.32 TRINITY_DN1309_c0_g1_i5:159-2117(+)